MAQSRQPLHELVSAHLSASKKNIDAGVYYKALGTIKDAKFTDPRNIYIIALEKQVKQLADLSKINPGADVHKNEIRDAIPELIRRAIDDSRKREESFADADHTDPNNGKNADPYVRERELALKKLKDQFIKVAETYIDRGDYQSALDEIRRIFIIDPENSTAKNLETRIQSLVNSGGDEVSEPEPTPVKKRRSFSLRRFVPFAIAILIIANVIIFYITSMLSSDDNPYTGIVTETDIHRYVDDDAETNTQPGNVLPDVVMREREYIHASNEIDDNLIGDTSYIEDGLAHLDDDDVYVEGGTISNANTAISSTITAEEDKEPDENPNALVLVDEPDAILRLQRPVYPSEALAQGIEGDVVVRVLFDTAGIVNVSFIESSDHPLLSDSALESARLSQFSPADMSDLHGPQWVSIPYRYRITR